MFADATRRYGVRNGNHGSSVSAVSARGIKYRYVEAMTMLDKELYLARYMETLQVYQILVNKPPLLSSVQNAG